MKSNTAINLIGVRFGDNDFYNTMMPLFELFIGSALAKHPENITKARIVSIWNSLAPGIYWLRQNGYHYRTSPEDVAHIEKYLTITDKQVYLDDEVLDHLAKDGGYDNGEFVYVDLARGEVSVC